MVLVFTGSQTWEIKLPKLESQVPDRNLTLNFRVKIIKPPLLNLNQSFFDNNVTEWHENLPKSQSLRMSSELMRRFSGLMSERDTEEKRLFMIKPQKKAASQSSLAGEKKKTSKQ